MGKASAKEVNAQTLTPTTIPRFMNSATPSTSKSDHVEDHDAITQRMVDEQLFRELYAAIPVKFKQDDSKTVTTSGVSALKVAEKKAQKTLGTKLRLSNASLQAAKVDKNRLNGELAASGKYASGVDEDGE